MDDGDGLKPVIQESSISRAKYGVTVSLVENNNPKFLETRPYEGIPPEQMVPREMSKRMWQVVEQGGKLDGTAFKKLLEKSSTENLTPAEMDFFLSFLVVGMQTSENQDEFFREAWGKDTVLKGYIENLEKSPVRKKTELATIFAYRAAMDRAQSPRIEFDGIIFERSTETSYREYVDYIIQTGMKFGYLPESEELAEIFLLHTRPVTEAKTEFEKRMAENLIKAQEYSDNVWADRMPDVQGIRDIGELMLRGLVPKGNERLLRAMEIKKGKAIISKSFSIREAMYDIMTNTDKLLAINKSKLTDEQIAAQAALVLLSIYWTHPLRDANTRLSIMMAEKVLKLKHGPNAKLDMSGAEPKALSKVMDEVADKFDTYYKLLFMNDGMPLNKEEFEKIEPITKRIMEWTKK